ncbi:MAG: hypothetical protein IH859_00540 [Chloroflexi bacterium]|nr:hypothetical protein [Chloroflexota bacterium]
MLSATSNALTGSAWISYVYLLLIFTGNWLAATLQIACDLLYLTNDAIVI